MRRPWKISCCPRRTISSRPQDGLRRIDGDSMARVDVLMPQMGESIAEGTLSKWLKKLGDEVKRDEPLFEISTDKVDAEIPAPSAGVLAEIKVLEGQTVPVQTLVAVIETDKSAATTAPPSAAARAPAAVVTAPPVAAAPRAPAAPGGTAVSPPSATAPSPPPSAGPVVHPVVEPWPGDRVEPFSKIRKITADHMIMSRRTSAHVTSFFEIDYSRVAELRRKHKAASAERGVNLTYLAFIA